MSEPTCDRCDKPMAEEHDCEECSESDAAQDRLGGMGTRRMRVTTEDLYGTRADASPEQRADLRHDVEVPKGTRLLRCKNLGDRWRIVVPVEGKRTSLITFRNPLGVTRGERLGPRYGLHEKVKLKRSICGLTKGARGVVVGYAALDSYHVECGGKVAIVGGEYLSSSKVTRCA